MSRNIVTKKDVEKEKWSIFDQGYEVGKEAGLTKARELIAGLIDSLGIKKSPEDIRELTYSENLMLDKLLLVQGQINKLIRKVE